MQKFGGGFVTMVMAFSHSPLLLTNYCLSLWEKDAEKVKVQYKLTESAFVHGFIWGDQTVSRPVHTKMNVCCGWKCLFESLQTDTNICMLSVQQILCLWRGALISFPTHCGEKKTGQPIWLLLLVTCPKLLLLCRISTLWYSQTEYFEWKIFWSFSISAT